MTEKIITKEKEHGLKAKEIKELKDKRDLLYAQEHKGEDIGELTTIGQEKKALKKEAEIEELKPLANIPEKHVGEIPPEPDTDAIIHSRKKAADEARESLEHSLGVLDHPRLKSGAIVNQAIEDVHKSSSDLYNSARKIYVDQKIKADNTKEIREVKADLEKLKNSDELAPGYGIGTEEQKALESHLTALEGEEVAASDIFSTQRTLEKMAKNVRDKQYSGVTENEFNRLKTLSERLESHADTLAKRLESVGGKEVQSMIKEANKGWKTYKEVSRNPIGKAALNKGELPSRAMIDIANTQSGNEFLRALTETYPELKKHMLAAHVGETSVNKLTKPTSLTKEYLKALPEVEDKVQELKIAIAGVKEGQTEAKTVKSKYDALVKSMKEEATKQAERIKSKDAIVKLDKQVKFHRETAAELEPKIKEAERLGEDVSKMKEDFARHKREYSEGKSRLNVLKSRLLTLAGTKVGYDVLFKEHKG